MMTFSQYLEERKLGAYALAGIVGGVGLGSTPRPHAPQITTISTRKEAPVVQQQPVEQPKQAANVSNKLENFHNSLKKKHENEYETIMDAAKSNGIARDDYQNLSMLFAIRKTENGGPGVEFGVLHPKAKGTNLRTQAGWAAATIMKNRGRHNPKKDGDFISFLGSRYAPKNAENDPHGLNANWIKNASHHYNENMGMAKD